MPEIQERLFVFPQHEEATRNKLHRYFSDKLDGIFVTLEMFSRSPRTCGDYKMIGNNALPKKASDWCMARESGKGKMINKGGKKAWS